MGYPRKNLVPNEEVVLDLNPHWSYLLPQSAALTSALVLGAVVLLKSDSNALRIACGVALLAALVWFVTRFVSWRSTDFVVTTERCIYRSGIISHTGMEIPLERINTVFYKQTIFERLIGSGNIAIESGGERGREEFARIRKPERVQHAIYTQKELSENKMYDRIGAEAAEGMRSVAAQTQPSIPDQIQKLAELRDQGVVSDAEFEAKKADLLNRM